MFNDSHQWRRQAETGGFGPPLTFRPLLRFGQIFENIFYKPYREVWVYRLYVYCDFFPAMKYFSDPQHFELAMPLIFVRSMSCHLVIVIVITMR